VVVAESTDASGYASQRAPDHQAPRWPDPDCPSSYASTWWSTTLIEADEEVVKLGAARLAAGDRVYADPAGHPCCLIPDPDWAPPIKRRTPECEDKRPERQADRCSHHDKEQTFLAAILSYLHSSVWGSADRDSAERTGRCSLGLA
jgi:hypothetical protein